MLETSARLLRLLSLLQSRRFWTGPALAERLQVTERTLRRDIDKLRGLGYPVDGSAGVAGGYQLGAGATLPPLQLEDDEALAVSIGLSTASASSVAGIDEAALRALTKLERVLPTRLRSRANSLRAAISALDRGGPRSDASALSTLAAACSEHVQVRFRYSGGTSKRPMREVEPVGLVHTGTRWYLVAWDTERSDWRTFRVDRIIGGVESGQQFMPRSPPDDGDLRRYVTRSVSLDPHVHQARVRLAASLETVAERIPPAVGVLEHVDEKSCVMHTGAHSLDALAYWVNAIGVDYEVEHPPELLDRMRKLHERLGRALERSPRS